MLFAPQGPLNLWHRMADGISSLKFGPTENFMIRSTYYKPLKVTTISLYVKAQCDVAMLGEEEWIKVLQNQKEKSAVKNFSGRYSQHRITLCQGVDWHIPGRETLVDAYSDHWYHR